MSGLRVLIVTSWYPNKSNPVYGTFVREQAQALAKHEDVEVTLFYPSDPEAVQGDGSPASGQPSMEDGVKTYRANLRFSGNPLKYMSGGFLAVRQLKKIIRSVKPDIIHSHVCFPAGILTYFATLGASVPYVVTEHMSYLHEYTEKLHYRILLKQAYEKASKVFVVSSFLAKQFGSLKWNLRLETFPNLVDTTRFTFEDQININKGSAFMDRNNNTTSVNLLFVGGMDAREVKGLQYLLPAFAEAVSENSQNKKPHLHLVGDGVKRSDYEHMVLDLGISDYCTFHGSLPPEKMPKMYKQCDFLVLSSLKETFGVVLIEAFASGKPVVATACGGPETIVKPEVGILVEKESTSALAEGLNKMINTYQEYSPETIRAYAEGNYSAQVISKKLISLYQEILTNKS